MKKKIFETLVGLSAISIASGIALLIYQATKGYEFNLLNLVYTLAIVIALLLSNILGGKILELSKVKNENN